ncbi:lysophospholipid acyltransferase family protein [bacterium]|nr:lysophospholipid acyltransferase family protein [bacterium]
MLALYFAKVLCRVCPKTSLQYLGILLGDIIYFFAFRRKAITRFNLELVLGKDKRKLSRKILRHLGISIIEFLSLPYLKPEKLKKFCLIKGKENLEQALKLNKGVIVLTAHFGNWELVAARLVLDGFNVIALARPQGEFDKYIEQIRTRLGYKTISVDGGILPLLSYLKEGAVIALLSDQRPLFGGVVVPYFGIPASTPPGAAILSLRSGAPIVPIYDVRFGNFHIINIQPSLQIIRTGSFKKCVIKNSELFNSVIEEWVRQYPEQWLWSHNRWKQISYREK